MSDSQGADSIQETEQASELENTAIVDSPIKESTEKAEPESLNDIIDAVQNDVLKRDDNQDKDKKTGDEPKSEQAEAKADEQEEPESESDGAEKQPEIEAPQDWPQARKEAFTKLPTAEAKQALLDAHKEMQAGFTRKSQEQAENVRFAEGVRGLIDDQTRQRIAAEGRDETAYMRQLVGLEQYARSNPVDYIKTAMQTLGVSPDQMGLGSSETATEDDLTDPDVVQLRQQVDGLSGSVQQTVQQALQQYQQQQEVEKLTQTVNQFSTEKDKDGNLLRPHFEKVRAKMARLVDDYATEPDLTKKWQMAYDDAVWADSELRPMALKEQSDKAAEAERKKLDIEKAKRAKSPVGHSSAPATKASTSESLDDIIADATRQATAQRV